MGPPDGYLTCLYCRCDYIILEEAIHKEDRWVCVGQNEYFSELLPMITHRDIRLERTGDAKDFTRCALILVGPTRLPHCSPASTQVTVRDNGGRIENVTLGLFLTTYFSRRDSPRVPAEQDPTHASRRPVCTCACSKELPRAASSHKLCPPQFQR